jgi:tetratricopeptide (TPR) repeat protein
VWKLKGNAYLSLENYQNAIYCYDKALLINSDDYEVLINKGKAFQMIFNEDEAHFFLNKAEELKSKNNVKMPQPNDNKNIIAISQNAIIKNNKTETHPEIDNQINEKLKIFELIRNIIHNKELIVPTEERNLLNKIDRFINEDFIGFSKKSSPPESALLFFDFNYEYERFTEFVEFPKLAEKNVVGLGGGFSSGKSTFLNSLFKRTKNFGRNVLLPQGVNPTTSIPTYIISGSEEKVRALNIFKTLVDLEPGTLIQITHDFARNHKISLAHILKSIFVEVPEHKFDNIAFLDTPADCVKSSHELFQNCCSS